MLAPLPRDHPLAASGVDIPVSLAPHAARRRLEALVRARYATPAAHRVNTRMCMFAGRAPSRAAVDGRLQLPAAWLARLSLLDDDDEADVLFGARATLPLVSPRHDMVDGEQWESFHGLYLVFFMHY